MTYRIALVVGSLRRESFNRQLATALAKLAPKELELVPSRIDDLPLYNQDDDSKQAATVLRLKSEVAAAQGVLFVTPEYNRSLPGVLKNAIDNASPTSTCRRSASPSPSSRRRTGCSMPMAASVRPVGTSSSSG
jgi:NAD(P)H-dependent FMN reductase